MQTQRHTSSMWTVGDNREYVLQDVGVVRLIKALGSCIIWCNVLQHLIQDTETRIRDVPHRVLECPYDRIKNQLELLRWDGQKCYHKLQHNVTVICASASVSKLKLADKKLMGNDTEFNNSKSISVYLVTNNFHTVKQMPSDMFDALTCPLAVL